MLDSSLLVTKRFQVSLCNFPNRCCFHEQPFQGVIPCLFVVGGVCRQEDSKGRCQFVTTLLDRTAPSYHASRATAWESYTSLHLGKQVYHVESASASCDGLD